jgi:uncharacterized membrane protein YeaQ/YmgE (transglycosylase-associated protein family)
MAILWLILFGFIVGLLARALVPGGSGGFAGCLPTIVLGIVGSILGGFIGQGLGFYPAEGVQLGKFFMSLLGAVIVLVVYGAITKNRGA